MISLLSTQQQQQEQQKHDEVDEVQKTSNHRQQFDEDLLPTYSCLTSIFYQPI